MCVFKHFTILFYVVHAFIFMYVHMYFYMYQSYLCYNSDVHVNEVNSIVAGLMGKNDLIHMKSIQVGTLKQLSNDIFTCLLTRCIAVNSKQHATPCQCVIVFHSSTHMHLHACAIGICVIFPNLCIFTASLCIYTVIAFFVVK